jgi:hypothetical protein
MPAVPPCLPRTRDRSFEARAANATNAPAPANGGRSGRLYLCNACATRFRPAAREGSSTGATASARTSPDSLCPAAPPTRLRRSLYRVEGTWGRGEASSVARILTAPHQVGVTCYPIIARCPTRPGVSIGRAWRTGKGVRWLDPSVWSTRCQIEKETSMPLYFRKSKKLGPVRMTVSKSGVTTSAGAGGARFGIGPRGTYIHVGHGGTYYRQSLNRKAKSVAISIPIIAAQIADADVDGFVDASSVDVLDRLNNPPGSWLARIFGRTKPETLAYDLEDESAQRFAIIERAINTLAQSAQIWRVDSQVPTSDRKHYGGASKSVTRHPARAGSLIAPGIETNISVLGIDSGGLQYFFFPDHIFVRRGKRYGAVSYDGLQVRFAPLRFNEEGKVPGDARIVGETWHYVNKSGGPDKRFKDNRKIPIALYGELHFTTPGGLNVLLEVSSAVKAQECQEIFASFGAKA